MGVTNLWQILQPISKPLNLNELKNKTLVVDLSIWICENSAPQYGGQSGGGVGSTQTNICMKPYLRTLFFRCKSLIELDCKLIFVREGDVIDLKQNTMEKRVNSRFGMKKPIGQSQSTNESTIFKTKKVKRSHFESVVNECCELLDYMGITVIRSPCGEAEKACAYLNLIGKCDAVISDDSDVFLYGARVVYKNFCIDKKSDIKIEEYRYDDIESKLKYTRDMLVILALILGCDYDTRGLPGVGKETACKFLNEIIEYEKEEGTKVDILNLVRKWSNPNYAGIGLVTEKKLKKSINNTTEFPNEKIIEEYLCMSKQAKDALNMNFYYNYEKWRRPHMMNLQVFTEFKLQWKFDYTADKVAPLIILYEHMLDDRTITPIEITKMRRNNFIEYFEVKWAKLNDKQNQFNDRDLSELNSYLTLEKPELFKIFFPYLVDEFNDKMVIKKQKKSKKDKKNKEDGQEGNDIEKLAEEIISLKINEHIIDENLQSTKKTKTRKKTKEAASRDHSDDKEIENNLVTKVDKKNKKKILVHETKQLLEEDDIETRKPIVKIKVKNKKESKKSETNKLYEELLAEINKLNDKDTELNIESEHKPLKRFSSISNTSIEEVYSAKAEYENAKNTSNDDSIIILDNTIVDTSVKNNLSVNDEQNNSQASNDSLIINKTVSVIDETLFIIESKKQFHQSINQTIILGESDEEGETSEDSENEEIAVQKVDDALESVLNRLNNIHIKSIRKEITTTITTNKSSIKSDIKTTMTNAKRNLFESSNKTIKITTPLPFSSRMKKIYSTASIYSNDA